MNKRLILYVFMIFMIVSCKNDSNLCHITGRLENVKDSTVLYLVDIDSWLMDSIIVVNDKFQHEMQLNQPRKFLLRNKRNQYKFRDRKIIWLEPSQIKISGDYTYLQNLKVEGSKSQTEFEKYTELLDNENKQINKLQEEIHLVLEENKKQTINTKIDSLKLQQKKKIIKYITVNNNSQISLSALHAECYDAFRHLGKNEIKDLYFDFTQNLKTSPKGQEIKKYILLPDVLQIGDRAVDIIQTTPQGDTIKLSDFKGKYLLIDFWSSGCGPCRADHKWLRELYDLYNPKGFEILGVSGDSNKRTWEKAIMFDTITWINISDLKGWKNEAFLLYDVNVLPDKILLNREGVIIGRKYNSKFELEKELKQIFK